MARKPKSFRVKGSSTAAERERQYDRTRQRNQAGRSLYGTGMWRKARAEFLSLPENQFCVRCLAKGILNSGHLTGEGEPQTNPKRMHLVVHHSQRHYGNLDVFWDRSKWQPVCPDHHDGEIQIEQGEEARKIIRHLEGGGRVKSSED